MPGRLQGRVAIVTGSGQSIGRAIALLLAEEGARVVVNSRSEKNADGTPTAADTASEIAERGGEAAAVFADAGTMAGAKRLVEGAVERFGALDILVNNAGFGRTLRIEEMEEAEWDGVLDANLKALYATSHYAVAHLRQSAHGRIINVISRVGLAGSATMSAYAAAKAGGMGFTFALAKELAADKITVNCLAPTVNTVRALASAAERHAMIGYVVPQSEKRTPAHVAPSVVFLATDEAATVTGQVFYAAAGEFTLYSPPSPAWTIFKDGMWTVDELISAVPSVFGTTLAPPVSIPPPV